MLSTKKLIYKILNLPLVVEEGSSSIWTYRKWSDGVAEGWCKLTFGTNITTAWGSLYINGVNTLNFPSGLFIEAPIVSGTAGGSVSSMFLLGSTVNTTGFTYQLARGTSQSGASCTVHVYVVGRWK